jgi:hypothetical protein
MLPVRLVNDFNRWYFMITQKVVDFMGMENMMFAIVDYPDKFHTLMQFITDDMLRFVDWQEEKSLLFLNNGNDYAGGGSYGFTERLPSKDFSGRVISKDLWINTNSQESISISSDMYKEFIYPYYEKLTERFGLTYYGCCEPVSAVWTDCVENLPNLKKVSISPWCDEAFMGERLADSDIIYSRKPSPNFVGVDDAFDKQAYAKHIANTLKHAKGCNIEFILRDIYSLKGDIKRANEAVEVIKQEISKM